MTPPLRLSIIVPVLNEAGVIAQTLDALAPLRAAGHEVIVVDGGSSDGTQARYAGRADTVLDAPRGRARQMNAGAARAQGDVLLFLHADTRLPPQADVVVARTLATPTLTQGADWGRFDVRIAGRSRLLPLVAALMNLRSRLTGIATGDQAMFVRFCRHCADGRHRSLAPPARAGPAGLPA
jgi:glycosyltransferase involved in cell wall biosynthesis